jgi:hypothetical protein
MTAASWKFTPASCRRKYQLAASCNGFILDLKRVYFFISSVKRDDVFF